jgi:DNA repair exonuclease SbcCD nuclease subunit
MDFCFVHAADLHLDSPFAGIRTVSPKLAEQLQDASLEAFDRLIDLAVEHTAAFLLLAGDIYDQSERGVRAQLRFLRGMQRLQSNKIPVYCAFGNHDHLEGDWPAVREWPGNVRFFPAEEVGVFEARTSGQLLATIYGCSYGRRAMRENMALHYHASAAERLHIGVLHCSLGARGEAGAYSDCTEEELARAGMDYWALGHFHQHDILRKGDPWIVYSGSLQGRSLRPSEQGPKGAVVVRVRGQTITEVNFHALDRVRFLPLSVDAGNMEDLAELREQLEARAEVLYEECGGRHLVLRGQLTGRGPLHESLQRAEAVSGLLAELRAACEHREPFLFWEDLRDQTRAELDRDAILRRDDFSAEVIRCAQRLLQQAEELAAFEKEQFRLLDKPRLRKWVETLPADRTSDLVEEATALALEMLEEGKRE